MNPFKVITHSHSEFISNYIRKHGCWEPITTEVLIEVFRSSPGSTFVDIGANIGWFSLVAASEGVPVVAFEPVDENYQIFRQSIDVNGWGDRIDLRGIAIGEEKGSLIINISPNNMGVCSTRDIRSSGTHCQLCDVERLDDILNTGPLVVKVDVEHMELNVLRGMEKLFQKGLVTHLVMEISFHQKEIFDILRRYGFTTVVNIGFDHAKKRSIRTDNNYLGGGHWFQTLDGAEKFIMGLKGNPQCMFMFINKEHIHSRHTA
jgi:FkbM family methyltransferase